MNAIEEFATSFLSLKLHAVNILIWKKIPSLALFKIITASKSSTLLRIVLMRRSGCPTKGRNLGGLPASQKFWTFPFCWMSPQPKKMSPPVPWSHSIYWKKKVSPTAFRQILSNILPEACIFSNTIMTYLKKFIGTKSLDTKQCPARLSPRIIPHYPPKHLWETLGMGKNQPQQPKMCSFLPPEKKPLTNSLL